MTNREEVVKLLEDLEDEIENKDKAYAMLRKEYDKTLQEYSELYDEHKRLKEGKGAEEMTNKEEVVKLLEDGGELIRDFTKDSATFMVIKGMKVKRFPLTLLREMIKKKIVEIKDVVLCHSIYGLVKKKVQIKEPAKNDKEHG